MSKTYRRKNDFGYGFSEPYEFEWVDGSLVKQYYEPDSKKYKEEKSKFHRDKKRFGGGVPRYFRNELERSFRGHTKKEVKSWIKDKNHEVMAPEFRHTAGWYYW